MKPKLLRTSNGLSTITSSAEVLAPVAVPAAAPQIWFDVAAAAPQIWFGVLAAAPQTWFDAPANHIKSSVF